MVIFVFIILNLKTHQGFSPTLTGILMKNQVI